VKPRITARKYGGDDAYSWAVFIDGSPMVTGLTRREVPYHKKQAAEILARRASMEASPNHP
jgi:hypothetical protein